jgi:hypothetical protein
VVSASVRGEIAAFARRLVPLASEVRVDVEDKALAYLPKFGAFIDVTEHNIMTAILGDGPSDRWAEGSEATSQIPERTEYAAMPQYDNLPTKW